jgi:PAS domain S-box-containing protein
MIKLKAQFPHKVARSSTRVKKNRTDPNNKEKKTLLPMNELYNLLFNSINDEIFIYEYPRQRGIPTKFLEVNGVACKQLGYTREELLQKNPYDIYAPETIPNIKAMMKKLVTQKYAVWEGIHLTKNGHRIPIEVSNRLIELKGKSTVISAVRDITARRQAEEVKKQAEQAVRESENRFKTLAEASFEGIALTENGIIIDMNDQLAHMFGYKRSVLIGKPFKNIIVTELRAQVYEAIRLDKRESYEIRGLRKNGKTFPAEIRGRNTRMDGKELYISTIRDITERKRIEEALKNEKAFLDALMNNIPDSIYFKDRQCRVLRVNRKEMQDLHVADLNQVVGKTDVDLYGKEFGRTTMLSERSLMKSGKPVIGLIETRKMKNGKLNWTSSTKVPLRNNNGEIVGLVGITREINEIMKAQEERERERILLRTLIDNMPELINLKNLEGRYILNNRAHLQSLGVEHQEDVLGKTMFDFHPAELVQRYYEHEMQALMTGESLLDKEELVFRHDTGDRRWHLTSKIPLKDHQGKVMSIISISTDITERKHYEEKIQRERTLLRTLINNLPDAVFVKDIQCRKIIANPVDLRYMGAHSEEEVIGKTDFDFFTADAAAAYYAEDQSVIQSGIPIINREECIFDKKGNKLHILSFRIPLRNEHGDIVGIVGVTHDITEQKQMEEKLRETADKFQFVFDNAYDGLSIFEESPDRKQRKLIECNKRYAQMAGRSKEELLRIGTTINIAKPISEDHHESNIQNVVFKGSFSWIRPDGKDNVIEYTAVPIKVQEKTLTIGIDRDITQRKRIEEEREHLIKELQEALADVKTLSGLVPICANCKQIRDDKGFWMQVESYIQEHSQARFSHGICPDCMRKLYPEFLKSENG